MAEGPDEELDALLEEALEDFEKLPNASENLKIPNTRNKTDEPSIEGDFSELTNNLTDVLEQMVKNEPSLKAQFDLFQQKMEDSATGENNDQFPFNVDEGVAKTLEELSKNFEGLSANDDNEDIDAILKQMQSEMECGDGEISEDGFMAMMKGMMQNLLSKDLLYPSLSQIKDKYPAWLEANKEKISSEDFQKYSEQQKLMCKLCQVFEEEKDDDSKSVQSERMSKVISLMEQMQQYGHPPAEMMENIVGDHGGLPLPSEIPGCNII